MTGGRGREAIVARSKRSALGVAPEGLAQVCSAPFATAVDRVVHSIKSSCKARSSHSPVTSPEAAETPKAGGSVQTKGAGFGLPKPPPKPPPAGCGGAALGGEKEEEVVVAFLVALSTQRRVAQCSAIGTKNRSISGGKSRGHVRMRRDMM